MLPQIYYYVYTDGSPTTKQETLTNVVLMAHRLRRWPNIKPPLGQHFCMLAGSLIQPASFTIDGDLPSQHQANIVSMIYVYWVDTQDTRSLLGKATVTIMCTCNVYYIKTYAIKYSFDDA